MRGFISLAGRFIGNSSKLSRERFDAVKDRMIRRYENDKYQQPVRYASSLMHSATRSPYFLSTSILEATKSVTFEDIIEFHKKFFADTSVEIFVHGSANKKCAELLINRIVSSIPFETKSHQQHRPHPQSHYIINLLATNKRPLIIRGTTQDPLNPNSAAMHYYQLGEEHRFNNSRGLAMVLESIAQPAAFHQLRTVEQLGYIASASTELSDHIIGLNIYVQSSVKSGQVLSSRIDSFFKDLSKAINSLSEGKFMSLVTSAQESIKEPPQTLHGATTRAWDEILYCQYEFDRRPRQIKQLDLVKIQGVRAFKRMFQIMAVKPPVYAQVTAREHQTKGRGPNLLSGVNIVNGNGEKVREIEATQPALEGYRDRATKFPPYKIREIPLIARTLIQGDTKSYKPGAKELLGFDDSDITEPEES
ncbi:hypothetical protein AAMO2058_001739700 [Amorphochlora amoebiformis]